MTLPDADSFSTYGGAKANYGGISPVDSTTDYEASETNKAFCGMAMASRMVPRCELVFVGVASAPTPSSIEAMWKGVTATVPTGARSATGAFTFSYPASVQDELLVSHTLNLTSAWGQAEGATAYHVQCSAAANVVTVKVFDMAGVASDAVGATIRVQAR